MHFWVNYYGHVAILAIDTWRAKGFWAALYSHFLVMYFFWYIPMLLLVILATAIVTLHERKLIADIQTRRGPSKVGFFGFLQPISDAFKLLLKEYVVPAKSETALFFSVAGLAFLMALLCWNLPTISYDTPSLLNEVSILISFIFSLLHVIVTLLAGWGSRSRYSFLGGIRVAAQLVAYDILVILIYINLFFFGKEMNFENFAEIQEGIGPISWFIPFQLVMFFIAMIAETSRHPFDFGEAESELVSGYNTEFGSIRFALFSLAEYATVIYSAVIITILFLGIHTAVVGSFLEFIIWIIKTYVLIHAVIQARALLPRYRYDQLMEICWKTFIPIQISILAFGIFIIFFK